MTDNAEREAPRHAETSEALDKRDGRYTMRPDSYGKYEVLWSDGTVRLSHLDRESAEVAMDYFRRCDKASGLDGESVQLIDGSGL